MGKTPSRFCLLVAAVCAAFAVGGSRAADPAPPPAARPMTAADTPDPPPIERRVTVLETEMQALKREVAELKAQRYGVPQVMPAAGARLAADVCEGGRCAADGPLVFAPPPATKAEGMARWYGSATSPDCPCARQSGPAVFSSGQPRYTAPARGFAGHTHTCSRGHTWDHTMDGGSHDCPYPGCGEHVTAQDGSGSAGSYGVGRPVRRTLGFLRGLFRR